MKRLAFVFFLCLIFAMACERVSVEPLNTEDVVLERVEYHSGNEQWQEFFEYNDLGQLVRIEEDRTLGRTRTFSYNDLGQLQTLTTTVNYYKSISHDSLIYNGSGLVTEMHRYLTTDERDNELISIDHLQHNAAGQVTELSTQLTDNPDIEFRKVFTWKNGNVVKVDEYNSTSLLHEFYYTYDNKRGLNSPSLYIRNGVNLPTQNNVIIMDFKDHTGLLDVFCKPCNTSYTYNEYDLPATIPGTPDPIAMFFYKKRSLDGSE